MPCSITDEIIDAIIQNEHRHVGRSRERFPSARTLQAAGNVACVKPEWSQLPPGWAEDPSQGGPAE